jgi:hypothetical protein
VTFKSGFRILANLALSCVTIPLAIFSDSFGMLVSWSSLFSDITELAFVLLSHLKFEIRGLRVASLIQEVMAQLPFRMKQPQPVDHRTSINAL